MNQDSTQTKPEPAALTRRYERLLLAYPADYRATHGAEIVGTLLETAEPGRARPAPREAAGLIKGGLAARARKAAEGPVSWWADGLHLGLFLLALINLTYAVADYLPAYQGPFAWAWFTCSLLLAVALLRGWVWAALPIAAFASFDLVALAHSPWGARMAYDLGAGSSFPSVPPGLYRTNQMFFWILTAGLLVLAARRTIRPPLRHRSWAWLAIPPIALAVAWAAYRPAGNESLWPFTMALEAGLLLAGLAATMLAASPRWVVAGAVYMLPWGTYVFGHDYGPVATAYWSVLAIVVLSMAGVAYKVHAKV